MPSRNLTAENARVRGSYLRWTGLLCFFDGQCWRKSNSSRNGLTKTSSRAKRTWIFHGAHSSVDGDVCTFRLQSDGTFAPSHPRIGGQELLKRSKEILSAIATS